MGACSLSISAAHGRPELSNQDCLAPVTGNVERGDCGGGQQQQAGQGRGRWQGQEVHHCFVVQRDAVGKVHMKGQGRGSGSPCPNFV